MAASILLRNLGGVDDKRLALGNAQIARLLSVGTNWNKVRIGLRWSMTNTGANLTGTPSLAVGLCAGVTNIMGDLAVNHFVGMISNQATWTYAAGTPAMYRYTSGALFYACKKVGSSLTVGLGVGDYVQFPCSPAQGVRFIQLLDITKGSPDFLLRAFVCETTGDVSQDTLLLKMEEATPALAGYVWGTERPLAVDEGANGALNAVCLHWDRTNPVFEISDLAVSRLA